MDSGLRSTTLLARDGVVCNQLGSVATVTMVRPEVRNAMGPSMWEALASVGAAIGDDVRVVVVRGAGQSFSAGLDTRLFAGESVGRDAPLTDLFAATAEEFDQAVAAFQEGFVWLRDPRFISIAAVHGHSIGAGFQLALACDLRIATETAIFSMREPALGLIPDLTGTKHLAQAVGYARALEWTASARLVDADEALSCGLVSAVVPSAGLDDAIERLVAGLTAHSHGAVRESKALLLGASEHSFEEHRAAERRAQFRRFAAVHAGL